MDESAEALALQESLPQTLGQEIDQRNRLTRLVETVQSQPEVAQAWEAAQRTLVNAGVAIFETAVPSQTPAAELLSTPDMNPALARTADRINKLAGGILPSEAVVAFVQQTKDMPRIVDGVKAAANVTASEVKDWFTHKDKITPAAQTFGVTITSVASAA